MVARARLLVTSADFGFFRRLLSSPTAKRYELQGRVVAVDAAARQLTIAHQDIPGLMDGHDDAVSR